MSLSLYAWCSHVAEAAERRFVLPQKKNCMSYTPDFLDGNLRKHGKLITKTQKKSVTSNN